MKKINDIVYSDDLTVLCHCPIEMKGTVVIPEGTLGILQNAFKDCLIDAIVLPSTIERIGKQAFANCKSLKGIKLPNGLRYLGENAFCGCTRLSYVILPDSLEQLPKGAFSECLMLKIVQFPEEGLTEISDDCFMNCYSLEKITIPASVARMGRAFPGCWLLSRVIIKSSSIDVKRDAFKGCAKKIKIVKTFNIKGFFRENRKGCKNNKKKQKIGRGQLAEIKNKLKLRLPDSIVAINEYAFHNSTGLNEISIPGTVKKISNYAFAGCSGLSSLEIQEGVEIIGKRTFEGCTALTTLNLPKSIKTIGEGAFSGCESLIQISLPKHAVVADDAFMGSPKELRITYNEDVTENNKN